MRKQLDELLQLARQRASIHESRVVLTGILPTIRLNDLDFEAMTPIPRYRMLGAILREMRGEHFQLHIEGVDELNLRHENILFEACNTSFQTHLQIDPGEFVDRYNWAQIIAGPVLACCVNSPILLGRELWSETRIALFRQSLDVRHAGNYLSDRQPRVAFGRDWLHTSAAEIFKQDLAMYPPIIATDIEPESSLQRLDRGEIPRLRAMNMHNGTLYKWNRACYGIGDGKPHLRIENRYMSAGPTPADEMANAVFWIGLMMAMPKDFCGEWERHFWFQDVRGNFLRAARNGLSNEFVWFGKQWDAVELIREVLLPMTAAALADAGVPASEFGPVLKIIEERVANRQTGSRWIIDSVRRLRQKNSLQESLSTITLAMAENCLHDEPVHRWKLPDVPSLSRIPVIGQTVESLMITQVVTVQADDSVELAATLMEWNDFHHLPVENSLGKITGIISASDIGRYYEQAVQKENGLVRDCMTHDIVVASPEMNLDQAVKLMQGNQFGSLPVVSDGRVVGIITVNDIGSNDTSANDLRAWKERTERK
jgi:CBS domain-containing protein